MKPRDLRDYNSAQRYFEGSSTKKEDFLPVSQRCPQVSGANYPVFENHRSTNGPINSLKSGTHYPSFGGQNILSRLNQSEIKIGQHEIIGSSDDLDDVLSL